MELTQLMQRRIVTVREEATVAEAGKQMRDADVGCVVVADADRVLGIITDRDITVRCVAEGHDVSRCPVRDHMTKGVISAEPDADILEAAHLMTQWQVKRLPITKDGYLVGIVSFSDVANALDKPMHDLLIGMGAARRAA